MAELAILSPLLPEPPLSGGTAHLAASIRQLARAFRVHLRVLADDAVSWGGLSEVCASVGAFSRAERPPRALAPPAVGHDYSPTLVKQLQREWARQRPDVVQLETTTMAQYAPLARAAGALVVCTAHVAGCLAQLRRAQRERHPAMRARRWLGALSFWLYECRALRACDLIVALGPADAAVLRRWLPGVRVEHVPSGIDLETHTVCFDPRVEGEVLFIGNYLHPPNVEGARWLAQEIWPLVRLARPSARLTLAGRMPPASVRVLERPDVRVPGTLDDLRPCYARASVAVAPIHWGSGIRIKILEALAHGLPMVATPLAAEGIALVDEESALFAQRADDFAAAIVRLLDDTALRQRLGAGGRALVERDHDWNRIGARLIGLYQCERGPRSRHRGRGRGQRGS